MKRKRLSFLVIALFTVTAGMAVQVTAVSQEVQKQKLPSVQAQANANEPISVALPMDAEIVMKGGEKRDGRVVQIDEKAQKLWIQGSGEKRAILLSQIEKILFSKSAVVYLARTGPALRGDGGNVSPAGAQRTLPDIPMNAFTLEDANKGLAKVTFAGLSRGIRDTAKNRQFVVDEMQFNLPKKTMMIKATPY